MQPHKILRVQKLFVLAMCLKITSSALGWRLNDPWVLGFTIPLLIMAAYVVIGLRRHVSDVSDEKFADSCYYLGFIFTVSSIIFSLFDLPHIGERITVIAIRFGAAMVTTVAGLIVRVYLVSFRDEPAEALRAAEDSVVLAHGKLREQLLMTLERLQTFQSQIDDATRSTVERVNMQVEALTRSYGQKLDGFFEKLATDNGSSSDNTSKEVRAASMRVAAYIRAHAEALERALLRVHARLEAHTSQRSAYSSSTVRGPESMSRRSGTLRQLPPRSVESANVEGSSTREDLAAAVSSMRSIASRPDKASAQIIELAPLGAVRTESAGGHDIKIMLERISASLEKHEQATSRFAATVEQALKDESDTARARSLINASVRDAADKLSALTTTLNDITQGMRLLAPVLQQCQGDLRAMQEVMAAELRRHRARLGR